MEWSKSAQDHMGHMLPATGKAIKEACDNMTQHGEITEDDKMMVAKLDDEKTYNTVDEVNADAMK